MSIVIWIVLVALYLLIGLTICQMNREAVKNWKVWKKRPQGVKFLILFPAARIDNLDEPQYPEMNRNSFWLNFAIIFIWPLRVFALPLVIFALALLVGWIWIFCASAKKISQLGLAIYVSSFATFFAILSGYFSEKPEAT